MNRWNVAVSAGTVLVQLVLGTVLPTSVSARQEVPPEQIHDGPVQEGGPSALTPSLLGGFSLGVGGGSLDVAFIGSFWAGKGRWVVLVRGATTHEFDIFSSRQPPESNTDLAFLYGRRLPLRRGWLQAAAGPAVALVIRRGDYLRNSCDGRRQSFSNGVVGYPLFCSGHDIHEQLSSARGGLALQVDAVWAPVAVLGLGLTGFANLNRADSFGGVALSWHVGKQR